MLVALVCLLATPLAQATSWTGEPGAQWSPEEVLAVKAKIHEVILKSKRVYNQYKKIHPDHEAAEDTHDMPNAAKLLRLGFHDCLPTAGGTACDGCLNPTGMRTNPLKKYNIDGGGKAPDVKFTDNNGLGITADILEEIFVNPKFPKNTPRLSASLAESGKSRADLWAFASLVGAEWGMARNNEACAGAGGRCGHIQAGTHRCLLTPSSLPKFRTGRRDCRPEGLEAPWQTSQHEIHPDVTGNGVKTAKFFKEHFGLTGRQGAALLVGAHSLGKFNAVNSMFKYFWTRTQHEYLNNQLFRHLAMKPQYKGNCGGNGDQAGESWSLTGDYLGQPAETRWLVRGNKFTESGGPFQWGHWYMRCPSTSECARIPPERAVAGRNSSSAYPEQPVAPGRDRAEPSKAGCCEGLGEGLVCRKECQRWIINDEMALSVDTGYMLDFEVDEETGIPTGCGAFDGGRPGNGRPAGPVDCPLQRYAPEGEPLHMVVEEYAEDQDAWVRDFLPALQAMLENRNTGQLEEVGVDWWGANCGREGRTLVCRAFIPGG